MLPGTLAGDSLGLAVEIGDDGRRTPGSPDPAAEESRLVNQQGREVADEVAPLAAARPAQREGLAVEHAGAGIGIGDERGQIAHAERMVPPKRLARDGDILAAVRRGPRRPGEETDAAGSGDIALARDHALDPRLERIVIEHGNQGAEMRGSPGRRQAVPLAESRTEPPVHQLTEHPLLGLGGMAPETVDGFQPLRKPSPAYRTAQ